MALRIIIALILLVSSCGKVAAANFVFPNDPQYIIMNFATINELDWSVPEDKWKNEVKPEVVSQVTEMRKALGGDAFNANDQRQLGWSTLMEYMNFPLDDPGPNSPYAVKMRRILELSEELNIPVFIPLNGFQWWDQLPELYNWWDPDGNRTDPAFFARQKNPEEFKQRFIAGYNPLNIWNVEWRDWQTPMQLNYRNWGGGGFRLAPPPNLSNSSGKAPLPYKAILKSRLKVILNEIKPFMERWEKENKLYLLAGISIGTEISLNASVEPKDEFLPYGFRGISDQLCKGSSCADSKPRASEMNEARKKAVNDFLIEITRFVSNEGIPKQRLYTHVWGEAKQDEPRYVDYAGAALTLYSRPGMSFYGYAEDPLSLPIWSNTLQQNGFPKWGAMEYSAGNAATTWKNGLNNTFGPNSNSKILVIYNWQEHKNTPAIPQIRTFISEKPQAPKCELPEIIPLNENSAVSPTHLEWTLVGEVKPEFKTFLHVKNGIRTRASDQDYLLTELDISSRKFELPDMRLGTYSWYLEVRGCDAMISTSQPQTFIIKPETEARSYSWLYQIFEPVLSFIAR